LGDAIELTKAQILTYPDSVENWLDLGIFASDPAVKEKAFLKAFSIDQQVTHISYSFSNLSHSII